MTTNGTTKLDVLISGGGIAGLTAAHFLLQAGHHVTIVERAADLRTTGQSVDIRGHALPVLKRMKTPGFDIEAAVRANVTVEKGLRFIDAADYIHAEFPADETSSFTSDVEIMRGDLARILHEGVSRMPGVEILLGKHIASLDLTGSTKVSVSLSAIWESGASVPQQRLFDVVIVADGIGSYTRKLIFGSHIEPVRPLRQWACWFSIPSIETDPEWARWYNAPKGRMILVRPDRGKVTRVSLWTMTRPSEMETSLTALLGANVEDQKQYWCQLFHDAGWQAQRIIQGLKDADEFYMQRIGQVQLDSWCNGRVVMVGDAAYCPSPISGMGVTSAMTGAYILAGELNQSPANVEKAFKSYEEKMRPFVKKAQQLPPGTPDVVMPESVWGIWLLHRFLAFITWTKLYKLFESNVDRPSQAMPLPDYQTLY